MLKQQFAALTRTKSTISGVVTGVTTNVERDNFRPSPMSPWLQLTDPRHV